jgi:hypothetical protein
MKATSSIRATTTPDPSTPRHLNTSTPQHLDTSTPRHLDTSTSRHPGTPTSASTWLRLPVDGAGGPGDRVVRIGPHRSMPARTGRRPPDSLRPQSGTGPPTTRTAVMSIDADHVELYRLWPVKAHVITVAKRGGMTTKATPPAIAASRPSTVITFTSCGPPARPAMAADARPGC